MSDRMPGQRYQGQPSPAAPPQAWPGQPVAAAPAGVATQPQRYRSNGPLIGGVAAVLVVALAALLVWVNTRPAPLPASASSPSQTTPPPAAYTPSPNWQGIEFSATSYQATGYWQVSAPVWSGDNVTLTTTIAVDSGTMRFTFFALNNQSSEDYETSGGTMQSGQVAAGDSSTGTITFQLPHGDFTLYLANAKGVQVTALLIKA